MFTYANIQIDIRINEKWEIIHKKICNEFHIKIDKILYSTLYEEYIFQSLNSNNRDVRRFATIEWLLDNFELTFLHLTCEEVLKIKDKINELFIKNGLLDNNYCIPKSKMAKFNPKLKKFQETLGDTQETLGDTQETLKKIRRQTMKNISKYKKKYGENDSKTLAMIEKLKTIKNQMSPDDRRQQETLGDIGRHQKTDQETKEKEKTPPYKPPLKEKEKEGGDRETRAREETQTNPFTSSFSLTRKTKKDKDLNSEVDEITMANVEEKKNVSFRVLNNESMSIILQKKMFDKAIFYINASQKQIVEAINQNKSPGSFVNLFYNCLLPTNTWYKDDYKNDKIAITMREIIDYLYNLLERETRQGKKQNKQETLLQLYNEWKINKNNNVYNIFNFVSTWCEKEKWKSDGELHDKRCPDYTNYIRFIEGEKYKNQILLELTLKQRSLIKKIEQILKQRTDGLENKSVVF